MAKSLRNLFCRKLFTKYIIKLVDKSKTVCTCWCAINIQVFIWMEQSVIPNFLWSYSSEFNSACAKIRIFNKKKCPHKPTLCKKFIKLWKKSGISAIATSYKGQSAKSSVMQEITAVNFSFPVLIRINMSINDL